MYTISSSIPKDLIRCAQRSLDMEDHIKFESARLASTLLNFHRTCTEYHVPLYDIAGEISRCAQRNIQIHEWVKYVGNSFLAADRVGLLVRLWGTAGRILKLRQTIRAAIGWSELKLVKGSRYRGQIKVFGPHSAKKAVKLSEGLTHANWKTIVGRIAKGAVISEIIFTIFFEGPGIYRQNLQEYGQQGSTKVWVGTFVDLALLLAVGISTALMASAIVGLVVGAGPMGLLTSLLLLGANSFLVTPRLKEQLLNTKVDEILTDGITSALQGGRKVSDASISKSTLPSQYPTPVPTPTPTPTPSPVQSTKPASSFRDLLIAPTTPVSPSSPFKKDFQVTSYYGNYSDNGRLHSGLDIVPSEYIPDVSPLPSVYPIGPGKVVKVNNPPETVKTVKIVDRLTGSEKTVEIVDDLPGYGKYVVVEHYLSSGKKVYSLYAHLDEISVSKDVVIDSNTRLGTMGNTGNVRGETVRWVEENGVLKKKGGYHLHLAVSNDPGAFWKGFDNQEYNPDARNEIDKFFYDPFPIIKPKEKEETDWMFKPVSEWEDHLQSYSVQDAKGLVWQPVSA